MSRGVNYCTRCFWYNLLAKKCDKPKDEGWCWYTRSET
jgi:hypothetical protein